MRLFPGRLTLAVVCLLTVAAARPLASQGVRLLEVSGVARLGDSLLIVDDGQRGAYFRYQLRDDPGPVIVFDPTRLEEVDLPRGSMATDLESIDVLGDGRVAVLSERLRSLFGADGVIAEYDAPFSEFGKRGLEGLAVRRMPDRSSRVAVLWEGGYPEYLHVPEQLRPRVGRVALQPIILTHSLGAGETGVLVRGTNFVRLDVPLPAGKGPLAQRFRAPDLVWDRQKNGWGFIVLLSSQNSADKPVYMHHWLQRFSARGERIGDPIDLDQVAPEYLKGVNWEGLAWFEEGKSLVIVHESSSTLDSVAYILELPDDWRFQPSAPREFTHWVEKETEYYLNVPQPSQPTDGKLQAGAKVEMLEDSESYSLVRTDEDLVVYVNTGRLKRLPKN